MRERNRRIQRRTKENEQPRSPAPAHAMGSHNGKSSSIRIGVYFIAITACFTIYSLIQVGHRTRLALRPWGPTHVLTRHLPRASLAI